AAGAASFGLRGRDLHPGRLLVWLALAALSIYQARAIPFFAAASAPLLALNLQEWALDRRGSQKPRIEEGRFRSSILDPRSSILLRGFGVLAGVALLVLAWPGWLQPAPYQPRGWTVEPDRSLVRLARRLETWRANQQSPPGHFALTFSPEVAHHLAWFFPAEKGFLDARLPLFDRVAEDFVRMRR